jgi:polyhydroxyalkanoate synthase subunit PhaE
MSEAKSPGDWIKDWEALQRQYLNAWSDFAPKAAQSTQGGNPFGMPGMPGFGAVGGVPFVGMPGAMPGMGAAPGWHEGLEQWSRLFANSGKQSETAERVIQSAKSYMTMLQAMFGAAQNSGAAQNVGIGVAPSNPAQAWFESLRNGFATPAAMQMPGIDTSMFNNPFAKALHDITGHGAKGLTELPAAFAPFIEQMRSEGLSWLRVPAFGIGREHQEHYQQTALAFVEYNQALQNYNAIMLKASQRGFELFENKLAERGDPGRSIDSVRALYDLWVDAAEEAYAEIALSEEFGKVYGELTNAQMSVRAQIQVEVERIGTDLGMPTRGELNSVHKRLHELRRELRDGKSMQTGADELQAHVAALRTELNALKVAVANAQKKAAPAVQSAVSAPTAAGSSSAAAAAQKKPVAQERPRARAPRRRAVAAAKPRAPAPVVRPLPVAVIGEKTVGKEATFGDAIAAMRRRVVGKSRNLKAVAAGMSKPTKRNDAERPGKKSAKRKKK